MFKWQIKNKNRDKILKNSIHKVNKRLRLKNSKACKAFFSQTIINLMINKIALIQDLICLKSCKFKRNI